MKILKVITLVLFVTLIGCSKEEVQVETQEANFTTTTDLITLYRIDYDLSQVTQTDIEQIRADNFFNVSCLGMSVLQYSDPAIDLWALRTCTPEGPGGDGDIDDDDPRYSVEIVDTNIGG